MRDECTALPSISEEKECNQDHVWRQSSVLSFHPVWDRLLILPWHSFSKFTGQLFCGIRFLWYCIVITPRYAFLFLFSFPFFLFFSSSSSSFFAHQAMSFYWAFVLLLASYPTACDADLFPLWVVLTLTTWLRGATPNTIALQSICPYSWNNALWRDDLSKIPFFFSVLLVVLLGFYSTPMPSSDESLLPTRLIQKKKRRKGDIKILSCCYLMNGFRDPTVRWFLSSSFYFKIIPFTNHIKPLLPRVVSQQLLVNNFLDPTSWVFGRSASLT